MDIHIATTSSVTTGAREGPTGPVRIDPHCPTLAPGDLVPTIFRDVGTISTLDTQHSSVTVPALRSDPLRYVQSPATHVESIRDTLCSRDISVDVASRVSRHQRESTLAIYESKWRIFTAWCNMQHINPLSATRSMGFSSPPAHKETFGHLDHCRLSDGNRQHTSSHFQYGSREESCTEVATSKYRNGMGTINVIFQSRISP